MRAQLLILPLTACFALRCAGQRAASPPTPSAPANSPPPRWPVPPGWKSETLPFPLEFAPEIKHRGVEELRFMPGMFKPGEPGWWSYGFVWWVREREFQSHESLEGELQDYFRGLLTAVGKEKGRAIDPAKITVALHPLRMKEVDGWRPMTGEASVVDAFNDGKPLELLLWVYQRDDPARQRRAVVVLASPAPAASPVWTALHGLKDSFPR